MKIAETQRDMRCEGCPAENGNGRPCCIALDNRPLVAGVDGSGRRDTECLACNLKEALLRVKIANRK